MRDRETGSYWEHATGECIHGQLRGHQLEIIPAQFLLANQLLASLPSSLLVTAAQSWILRILERLTMRSFLSPEGYMPAPFRRSMDKVDDRLPEMQLGLGVWRRRKARFYPINIIKEHNNALFDTFGQERLLVYVDSASEVPVAHRCKASSYKWEGDTLILDTGDRITNGFIHTGGKEVRPFDMPEQQFAHWYGIAYKLPNCEIYEG